MSLFTPRKNLKTPIFSVIKIIVSIIIILLSILRKRFYSFLNIEIEGIFNILEKIIFLLIAVINIWIIYMAFIEIYYIYENGAEIKEKEIGQSLKGKLYLLDEIVLLLDKNDIIEIKIKADGKIIRIGSSSDCKAGSNKFFDKRFYIENNEYKNIETFINKIKSYVKDGKINVIFIDGIPVIKNRTNK